MILSDVDGLYSANPLTNPDAKLIKEVHKVDDTIESMAGGSASAVGTGGMYSKVLAAKKALAYGIRVNIISGRQKGLLRELIDGKEVGTTFLPQSRAISSRKGWIAFATRPKGALIIDDGAVMALVKAGKSLLPSGIKAVEGDFEAGDVVRCIDKNNRKVAKGIVNYSSHDISKIKGRQSEQIEELLGYKYTDEVIHRDNLAILV